MAATILNWAAAMLKMDVNHTIEVIDHIFLSLWMSKTHHVIWNSVNNTSGAEVETLYG
jgi:hypothetical protein